MKSWVYAIGILLLPSSWQCCWSSVWTALRRSSKGGMVLQVTKVSLWQSTKKVSTVFYKIRELWCYTGSQGIHLKHMLKGRRAQWEPLPHLLAVLFSPCLLLPCSFQSQTLVLITGKTHPFNNRNKDDSWMHMNLYFLWNRRDQERPILEMKSFL